MLVFSTHAFTEGDEQKVNIDGISTISTHAFTEGDGPSLTYPFVVMIFQLTPSRKATATVVSIRDKKAISTHAFTEGDWRKSGRNLSEDISTHAFTEGDLRPW